MARKSLQAEEVNPLVEKMPDDFFPSTMTIAEIFPDGILQSKIKRAEAIIVSHTIAGLQPKIFFEYPDGKFYAVPVLRLFEEVELARERFNARQRIEEKDEAETASLIRDAVKATRKQKPLRKVQAKTTKKRKSIRY